MQQREDPGSDGSEGSEQATPLGQEPWLEDGSGGLFSSGHAPTRLPAWQHTQLGTAHVHNPRDGPGRQASQQEEEAGEEVWGSRIQQSWVLQRRQQRQVMPAGSKAAL